MPSRSGSPAGRRTRRSRRDADRSAAHRRSWPVRRARRGSRPACSRSPRAAAPAFKAFFGPMPLMPSLKSVPTRIARSTSPSRVMPQPASRRSSTIVSGHDRPERALARKKLLARYREEADEPRRAEEQRVVVLARRRPHVRRGCGHVRRLRFAFGRRLHGRHAHQPQQLARLRDHLPRQPRGHRRLRVRLGQIAARQRRGALLLVPLPSGAPLRDLLGLAQAAACRRRRTRA